MSESKEERLLLLLESIFGHGSVTVSGSKHMIRFSYSDDEDIIPETVFIPEGSVADPDEISDDEYMRRCDEDSYDMLRELNIGAGDCDSVEWDTDRLQSTFIIDKAILLRPEVFEALQAKGDPIKAILMDFSPPTNWRYEPDTDTYISKKVRSPQTFIVTLQNIYDTPEIQEMTVPAPGEGQVNLPGAFCRRHERDLEALQHEKPVIFANIQNYLQPAIQRREHGAN